MTFFSCLQRNKQPGDVLQPQQASSQGAAKCESSYLACIGKQRYNTQPEAALCYAVQCFPTLMILLCNFYLLYYFAPFTVFSLEKRQLSATPGRRNDQNITESQNCSGWKGSLKTESNPPNPWKIKAEASRR